MDAKTKLIATVSQVFPLLASTALGSFRVVIGVYVVIGGNWKTRLQYFPKQLASFSIKIKPESVFPSNFPTKDETDKLRLGYLPNALGVSMSFPDPY